MKKTTEKVSLIFPAYNEEEAIAGELDKAKEVMDKSGWEYEIIVVDDGSKDNTARIAKERSVRDVSSVTIDLHDGRSRRVDIGKHLAGRRRSALTPTGLLAVAADVIRAAHAHRAAKSGERSASRAANHKRIVRSTGGGTKQIGNP